ncbi:transposase [Pedobacter borealis]|uniref:transposase n=1 Tax=Pedobacter borealis TaxID=475254 RepID=UPI0004934243|nr:transposase [Pedobacter borealis]
MAKTEHYYTKFEQGKFYHIYNRSIDRQPLFKSDANYRFFLKKFDLYLSNVLDVYAYCLLGNHFHLLIRVKESLKANDPISEFSVHDIVSKQFRIFFQSYALAFNIQHKRIGTLFQTPFKRAQINDESYFTRLVYYIHSNPQKHNLISDFRDWKWSSYGRILLEANTKLKKHYVLDWFGGKAGYLKFHSDIQDGIMFDEL